MSLYVYALVAKAPSEGLGTGMSGEALRVVASGRLLAVVGDMSARPRSSAASRISTGYPGVRWLTRRSSKMRRAPGRSFP